MLGGHGTVPAAIGDRGVMRSRPTKGSVMLNRSGPSFFHGKATSERPFCADWEAPIILSRLEPDKPGFDLRTFGCPMCCAATESIVVRV
jgi:hypothetical protein